MHPSLSPDEAFAAGPSGGPDLRTSARRRAHHSSRRPGRRPALAALVARRRRLSLRPIEPSTWYPLSAAIPSCWWRPKPSAGERRGCGEQRGTRLPGLVPNGRRIAYAVGRDIEIRGPTAALTRVASMDQAALVRLVTRRQPLVPSPTTQPSCTHPRHRQHRAQLDLDGLHGRRPLNRSPTPRHSTPVRGCRRPKPLFISNRDGSPDIYRVGLIGRVAPPPLRRGSRPGSTCTGSRLATAPCWSTPTFRLLQHLVAGAPQPERSPRPGPRSDGTPVHRGLALSPDGRWPLRSIGAATRRSIGRAAVVSRSSCRSMPARLHTVMVAGQREQRTTGSGTGADASS